MCIYAMCYIAWIARKRHAKGSFTNYYLNDLDHR